MFISAASDNALQTGAERDSGVLPAFVIFFGKWPDSGVLPAFVIFSKLPDSGVLPAFAISRSGLDPSFLHTTMITWRCPLVPRSLTACRAKGL